MARRHREIEELQPAPRFDPDLLRGEHVRGTAVLAAVVQFAHQLFEDRQRLGPRQRLRGRNDVRQRVSGRGDEGDPRALAATPGHGAVADAAQARRPDDRFVEQRVVADTRRFDAEDHASAERRILTDPDFATVADLTDFAANREPAEGFGQRRQRFHDPVEGVGIRADELLAFGQSRQLDRPRARGEVVDAPVAGGGTAQLQAQEDQPAEERKRAQDCGGHVAEDQRHQPREQEHPEPKGFVNDRADARREEPWRPGLPEFDDAEFQEPLTGRRPGQTLEQRMI